MKNVFILSLTFIFLFVLSSQAFALSCDHTVSLDQGYFPDGEINGVVPSPGDVICIEAGHRNRIKFMNFQGSSSKPLIFTNDGGQVFIESSKPECEPYVDDPSSAPSSLNCRAYSYGISFENSSFVHLDGAGDDMEYGFKIRAPFAGASVVFSHGSTNIEANNLEIYEGRSSGIKAKTDPDCAMKFTRNNFIAKDFSFHDNYIHHVRDEGFYIGNSFFRDGQKLTCADENSNGLFDKFEEYYDVSSPSADGDGDGLTNKEEHDLGLNPRLRDSDGDGVDDDDEDEEFLELGLFDVLSEDDGEVSVRIKAHIIDGVEVYDNKIEYSGMDGIQVSSAYGGCKIYNNYIYKDSRRQVFNQKSGMLIGGGSSCEIYDNEIIDGYGTGIVFLGHEGEIRNNRIVNPGDDLSTYEQAQLQGDDSHVMDGIYLIDKSGHEVYDIDERSIDVNDNVIITPKRDGIRYYNSDTTNNEIHGNLIVDPGSGEHYVRNNQWAGKEPAEYIFLQSGLIDRNEINGVGTDLEDFLIVDPVFPISSFDNLGFSSMSLYNDFLAYDGGSSQGSFSGSSDDVLGLFSIGKVRINDKRIDDGDDVEVSLADDVEVEISLDEVLAGLEVYLVASVSDWDDSDSSSVKEVFIGDEVVLGADLSFDREDVDSSADLEVEVFARKIGDIDFVTVYSFEFGLFLDSVRDDIDISFLKVNDSSLSVGDSFALDVTIDNKGFADQEDVLVKVFIEDDLLDSFLLDLDAFDSVNILREYELYAMSSSSPFLSCEVFFDSGNIADKAGTVLSLYRSQGEMFSGDKEVFVDNKNSNPLNKDVLVSQTISSSSTSYITFFLIIIVFLLLLLIGLLLLKKHR